MGRFYEREEPIAFVSGTGNPGYFHIIKNPDSLCVPQIATFTEMHEFLYKEEYKYLLFKLISEHRLPLGKLNGYDYEQLYVEDIVFRKIRLNRISDEEFLFYPVIEVFFSVAADNGNIYLSEWYSIPGKHRVNEAPWLFQDIQVYNYKEAPSNNMSEYLIPILENYDEAAEEMLKKYQPEVLIRPLKIDADKLAESMGFRVWERRLSKNNSVEGKIIFADATVKVYNYDGTYCCEEIPAGTILIDSAACEYNGSSRRTAIIHECVHGYQHKTFFELQHIYMELINQCDGLSLEDFFLKNVAADCIAIMERQAARLTPRVLMPATITRKIIDKLLNQGYLKDSFIQLEKTIRSLAQFYDVSIEMAKNRMVELGYWNARGVLNYVNGRYVPSYMADCRAAYNKSYTIPLNKLIDEMDRNHEFEKLMLTGKFMYVEGHVCIRDDRYIWYENRKPCLSPYARNHIGECCVLFTVRHEQADYQFIPDILNKDSLSENGEHSYSADYYKQLREDSDYSNAEERKIPDGFYDAFQYFKTESGMTYLDISLETHIDKSRLGRITCNDEDKRLEPTYNEVVAVALILCPTADLALSFIETCGYKTDRTAKQKFVRKLIILLIGAGIDEFNFAMVSGNYEPLIDDAPKTSRRRSKNVCSN